MRDDRYWPRSFVEDPGPDPVSLINEPVAIGRAQRVLPLRAVLAENLANAEALLSQLEAGVFMPKDAPRGSTNR